MRNLDLFRSRYKRKKTDSTYPVRSEVASFTILLLTFFLITYTFHCTWVSGEGLHLETLSHSYLVPTTAVSLFLFNAHHCVLSFLFNAHRYGLVISI